MDKEEIMDAFRTTMDTVVINTFIAGYLTAKNDIFEAKREASLYLALMHQTTEEITKRETTHE